MKGLSGKALLHELQKERYDRKQFPVLIKDLDHKLSEVISATLSESGGEIILTAGEVVGIVEPGDADAQ